MKIRTRLALRFVLIVAAILLSFSIGIFHFSSMQRESDFNRRLKNRALTKARLHLDVAGGRHDLLKLIEKYTINALYDERLSIYNDKDSLIYHYEEEQGSLHISKSFLDSVRSNGIIYSSLEDDLQMVAITHKGKFSKYVIITAARDEIGLTYKQNLKKILSVGTFFSLLITALFGLFYTKELFRPITKIIKSVDSITASSLTKRLNEGKGQDELEQLAMTFNKMLDRLNEAFEMQRRFVSNASHELRTPLTAVMGQIDVTLLKDRDQEEYKKILQSVQDEINKLTQLTNGLLKLAQVHSGEAELGLGKVRVDELLWSLKEDFRKLQPNYIVSIDFVDFPEEEELITIDGNESLLRTAMLNLVDNACKYSPDNKVTVKASFGQGIQVRFIDQGRGIPQKDLKNIIQPFYRGMNSSGIPGHGLGLSLADRIIKIHKGSLVINSLEGSGTEVIIEFKA